MTGSRSRERSSTELGSSIVPAVGLGSSLAGLELEAGLERRLKKKSSLDILKTLYRESAIALRYCRRLASGVSNPNVTKTIYYMRTLDE